MRVFAGFLRTKSLFPADTDFCQFPVVIVGVNAVQGDKPVNFGADNNFLSEQSFFLKSDLQCCRRMLQAEIGRHRLRRPQRINGVVDMMVDVDVVITHFKNFTMVFSCRFRQPGKIGFQRAFVDNPVLRQVVAQRGPVFF